jgi:hypothetical protein
MTRTGDQHTAADSAMGYLYQCRYALLAALRELKSRPNLQVSVERFDDISFDEGDDPKTLIQTKHQIRKTGNLNDLSTDLWKTISIWADQTHKDAQFPFRISLFLLTTGLAPEGSAASLLRPDCKDVSSARNLLLAAIRKSKAKSSDTLSYFAAFENLGVEQQDALLHAITVVDKSPNLLQVEDDIISELIHANSSWNVLKAGGSGELSQL